MRCYCGHELGDVNDRTKGACPVCQRSIWMQCAMLKTPDSEAIARELNNSDAKSCACTDWKTACFGFCGVLLQEGTWNSDGVPTKGKMWIAIPEKRRREWFLKLLSIPGG